MLRGGVGGLVRTADGDSDPMRTTEPSVKLRPDRLRRCEDEHHGGSEIKKEKVD